MGSAGYGMVHFVPGVPDIPPKLLCNYRRDDGWVIINVKDKDADKLDKAELEVNESQVAYIEKKHELEENNIPGPEGEGEEETLP